MLPLCKQRHLAEYDTILVYILHNEVTYFRLTLFTALNFFLICLHCLHSSKSRSSHLFFSWLKKSCFLKSTLLPNFAFNDLYTINKKIKIKIIFRWCFNIVLFDDFDSMLLSSLKYSAFRPGIFICSGLILSQTILFMSIWILPDSLDYSMKLFYCFLLFRDLNIVILT